MHNDDFFYVHFETKIYFNKKIYNDKNHLFCCTRYIENNACQREQSNIKVYHENKEECWKRLFQWKYMND